MAITYINSGSNGANSGTAVSVTTPVGIQVGDVIIAVVNVRANTGITDNNGANAFTSIYTNTLAFSLGRYCVFYRIATTSEPASYAFTLGTSTYWCAVVSVYRGVDSTIFRITPSASTHASSLNTAPTSPAISSGLTANDMIIAIACMANNYLPNTTPNGWNVRQNIATNEATSFVDLYATGSSQSAAAWALTNSVSWASNIFALKPASVQTNDTLFFGMNF